MAAPPTTAAGPAPRSGSGGMIALAGVATLGLLGIAGAIGYVAFAKKGETSATSEPPRAPAGPALADPLAGAAPASASIKKSPASATPAVVGSARPPTGAPSANAFALLPREGPRQSATPFGSTSAAPLASATPLPSASAAALVPQRTTCSRTVNVGKFRPSSPTCSFNEKVSGGPSKIEFPCEGGAATATFGTHTFRGTVTASSIFLTHNEPFTFGGCRVESLQRISGGRNAASGLYTYSERILSGACSGVTTCTASAIVELR